MAPYFKKPIYMDKRRDFIKKIGGLSVWSMIPEPPTLSTVSLPEERETPSLPLPTKAQLRWQNSELAALVCWDLHVFDGVRYLQKEARITPIADYNSFSPEKYDVEQWVRTLKEAGFKTAIFTVSHESGFFFHQSDATPYCMKALKWADGKGDILGDFKRACEKFGIDPGVYVGTRWNAFFGVHDFKVQGEGAFAENRQKYYNTMIENIVEEIFSRYGSWSVVWFDGGAHGPEQGGPDVLSVFEKYQPDCLFYHNLQRADMRWGGSETGTVPYPCWGNFPYPSTGAGESAKQAIPDNNYELLKTGDPNGAYYVPAMSDAPLRGKGGHDWFWEPSGARSIYPLNDLVDLYYRSVGHNTSLILGVGPNADGVIPNADRDRLIAFGQEINRRFARPLATAHGNKNQITLVLFETRPINQLVVQEDISHGERVRKFSLEVRTRKGWKSLFQGSCIGHKFILRTDEVPVKKIRLTIWESVGEPMIADFSAFYV